MQMKTHITINGRKIGPGEPTYIIAEMSGNHNQSFERATEMIRAMKEAGADAIKLQTYTPDTITIDSDAPEFRIGKGTLWEGKTLYQLYKEAYTPWEWQPKLKKVADELGIDLFSTPFDPTAVEFLEKMDVPAYKVASFELVDIPLIKHIAKTGKPMIISTGMGKKKEIKDAIGAAHSAGNKQTAILKCTSAYPSPPEEMNLLTIPDMAESFGIPVGLSDHTMSIVIPITAVALGACIVEKHFCLSREEPGPDTGFSLEPHEFKEMVDAIRTTEKALGKISYSLTEKEKANTAFRRSLFVVRDIAKNEELTEENVRSIRPASGLPPKELKNILGHKTRGAIKKGTPLNWKLFE